MTNRSEWVGGNLNSGLAWTPAFGAEINGLVGTTSPGTSVLSSVTFNNGASLDQFLDFSAVLPLAASEALTAGANISIWQAILQADGETYGDGRVTTTPAAYTPPWPSIGVIYAQTGTTTKIVGDFGLSTLRPVQFKLIMQNNLLFNLASSGLVASILTYNQFFNN